jgi:hypothetical protein
MTNMDCTFQGSLSSIFPTLAICLPIDNSQQYFNNYIYGFTSSYIFRYPTNLTSSVASFTVSNVRAITIDSNNNTLYYLIDNDTVNIYSISITLDTPVTIPLTLPPGVTLSFPTSSTQIQFFNFEPIQNLLYWLSGPNAQTINRITTGGTTPGTVSQLPITVTSPVSSVEIVSGVGIFYFCPNGTSYTIYTYDTPSMAVFHSNSNPPQMYTNGYNSYPLRTYNGNLYLSYPTNASNTFVIETINTTGTISSSYITVTLTGNLTTNYTNIRPIGLPIDNLGNFYIIPYATGDLYITSDIYCFNKGTKILCMNHQLEDNYVAIEDLKVGDFVKTFKHGYRKVSKVITGSFVNNPKKWNMCMYKMAKTESNGLLKDLIVTGGHSLLVDSLSDAELLKYSEMGIPDFANQTIDKKHLVLSCVSDQFTPMQDRDRYQYYHLLLENNDDEEERFGIWANGVLTETPNVKTVQ